MITIRYKDLAPGMHAEAAPVAAGVVVYLLPGLTPAQRKAALRRLRQEGSRGCGPYLPAARLGMALVADRLRVGARSTIGAIRHHPVGTLLPAVLTGGLLGAFVFASVYAQESAPSPGPAPGGAASWAVPAGSHAAGPAAGGAATTRALPTP